MRRLAAVVIALALPAAACTSNRAGTGAGSPTAATSIRASTAEPAPTSAGRPTAVPSGTSLLPTPSRPPATATPSTAMRSATPTSTGAVTARTVLRPVTASGAAAPGWTVRESADEIDCTFAEPSPAAVDPGIAFCAPSSASAIACWHADAGHALCAGDLARRTLVRHPVGGSFPATAAAENAAPFTMTLADGSACTIRDGGTGPRNLTDHPDWVAYYYCDGRTAVFDPRGGTGLDTTAELWTVHLASTEGEAVVSTVAVRSAVLLGTGTG